MQFFFALFLQLLTAATPVQAANLYSLCGAATSWCESNATCADTQSLGLKTVYEKACLPHRDYASCLNGKACSGTNSNCLTVSDLKGDNWNKVCLNNQAVLDNGSAVADSCQKDSDCVYQTGLYQCVRVTAYQTNGVNKFVSVKKCIDVINLPANLVTVKANSCGSNASCNSLDSCVQNVFEPSGSPSYVCYAKQYISNDPCTNLASQCTMSNGTKGICMNIIEGGKKNPKCVDPTLMPNGPNAPSTQQCNTDSDCKSQIGHPYCLKNPITLKNNCFSQQNIFTDMTLLPKQLCDGKDCTCKLPGTKACDPTGQESICAQHNSKTGALTSVCIKFVGDGAALGTGSGTPDAAPEHLKPDVAQQTYEMYAPKLQIDIPNLSFTDKITAEDSGEDDLKRFSIPYLATYINAVYKYSIGLGVLIAILTLMFAGFRWMTSFGNAKAVTEAKAAVGNSIFGLFLLFSAFTILYVINPDLPQMKALQILAPKQEVFEVEFPPESLTPQDEQESVVGGPYAFKYFTSCPVSLTNPVEYKDSSQKKPGDIRKNIARRVEFHNAIIEKNIITGSAQERVIKAVEATAQCKIQYENCGVATTNLYALATPNKDQKVLACLKNDSAGHSYNGTNGFCNFLGNSFGNAKKQIIRNAWGTVSSTLRGLYCPGVKSCGSKLGWTGQCYSDKTAAATKLKEILTASGKWSPNWINDLQPGDYYIVINWNPSCQSAHSAMFMGWKDKAKLVAYVEMADAANFVRMGTKSFTGDDIIVQISRPIN